MAIKSWYDTPRSVIILVSLSHSQRLVYLLIENEIRVAQRSSHYIWA
jgi:hypothetical protein